LPDIVEHLPAVSRISIVMKSIAVLLLAAIALMAADATGTWSGTIKYDDRDHTGPAHIVLKQEGEKVTGTAGPSAEEQFAIADGKFAGGHLTFEIAAQGMKFDLKQEGDQISGKIVRSHEGETRTATILLKRQP
jgi:hypothetical protein